MSQSHPSVHLFNQTLTNPKRLKLKKQLLAQDSKKEKPLSRNQRSLHLQMISLT